MNSLFELLKNNEAVNALINKKRTFVSDDTIGVALLIATSFLKKPEKYNIITSNLYNAQKMYDLLSTFVGEDNCLFYPCDELLRIDSLASSKEMLAQRLYVMDQLLHKDNYILIAHAASVMRFVPSPDLFEQSSLAFKVSEHYDIKEIQKKLVDAGYHKVNKIDHSLQFAVRGDILDINSVNHAKPIRLEFFDDMIESIRFFEMATQESIEHIEAVKVLPADEFLFTVQEKAKIEENLDNQLAQDMKQSYCNNKDWLLENISYLKDKLTNSRPVDILKKYYAFLQNEHYSILDYTKNARTFIANDEQLHVASKKLMEEATDFLLQQFEEGTVLSHLALYRDIDGILAKKGDIFRANELDDGGKSVHFNVRPIAGTALTIAQAYDLIASYVDSHQKTILSLANLQQYEVIKGILDEKAVPYCEMTSFSVPQGNLGLCLSTIDEGFELVDEQIAILTTKELFNYKNKISRYTNRYKEAVVLKSEQDLEPGDYVVHESHGVGRFLDIQTLEVDGIHRDFLHIQYAGSDVLYVPLEQFKLIRKFVGKEGAAPKLNKLGSGDWEKTKKRIKERINEMADRLFRLYSERIEVTGFAFKEDDELQREFESQFPFELTDDQKTSLEEIKKDMEKSTPMDRLLCGDVGFGKTEIAFRAAFKAILSGKQVALLCPTTLLARQHYERAMERFSAYGVKIAILSRLIEELRQRDYIRQIADGQIHLVIATHRLLSKNLHFQDLGLLIVDEEQRFGVEQKERIKEIKTNVDVLTLTATPIPRTLQISLLGIRQLSQLNTSPKNRMPIQTYVIPQNDDVVKELIERELSRNGQVFYLHNQVTTINATAIRIEKSIKSARVGIVHGQMDKATIEDVMERFYNNETNVLVCTSIIETGIDIANANMIIIENADRFGLSQLYQIKGRVGRGNRIAYAYLLYKPNKAMNDTARKRLKAIQDFTELGSGYKIAQRDLLIRGAGDILGPEQAGFIDTVGMDMYIQLLNEALDEKKTGKSAPTLNTNKTLAVDAYIPSDYVEKYDKIELYQEIDTIKSLGELDDLRAKTQDIYGKIPHEVEQLFIKKKISFTIESNPIFSDFIDTNEYVDIILSEGASRINGIGAVLFKAMTPFLNEIKVNYINKKIKIKLYKRQDWFSSLDMIIAKLVKVFEE